MADGYGPGGVRRRANVRPDANHPRSVDPRWSRLADVGRGGWTPPRPRAAPPCPLVGGGAPARAARRYEGGPWSPPLRDVPIRPPAGWIAAPPEAAPRSPAVSPRARSTRRGGAPTG